MTSRKVYFDVTRFSVSVRVKIVKANLVFFNGIIYFLNTLVDAARNYLYKIINLFVE